MSADRAQSKASPAVLVLWDVDHTLIETRGVGFAVYQRAFKAATGKELDRLAKVSGRTELDIAAETLRINGIDATEQAIAKLTAALVQGYEAARGELATVGRALPGAKEALEMLAREPAIYQSVLTGNLREVARIKLEVFGLDGALDLVSGAYGEDDHDRTRLVRVARQRVAERTGTAFTNDLVVLVGDTVNDVRAAVDAGVRVIAVASGTSNEEELRRAGADVVLPDLLARDRLKTLILGAID